MKQSKGYHNCSSALKSSVNKKEIPMIKKIYLRSLVNLTEKFKMKFNEDKYFSRFKALLEQNDKRINAIAIIKYFFTLFEESKKPIKMKLDILYLKDF